MLKIAPVIAALCLASGDGRTPQQELTDFMESLTQEDREAFVKSVEASLAMWKADCVRVLAMPELCSCLAKYTSVEWDFSRFVSELLNRKAPDGVARRMALLARDRCAEEARQRPQPEREREASQPVR